MIHNLHTWQRMLLLVALACTATALGDGLTIDWWTVDGGGDLWCNGMSLEVSGAVGQADTDESLTMTGATLSLTGGFWGGVPVSESVPGDCTGDGDVDLADYVTVALCMTGPDVGLLPDCECADLDGDDDSDVVDLAAFQQVFDSQ
jgi:hypothetical protein